MKKIVMLGCIAGTLLAGTFAMASDTKEATDWAKVAKINGVQRVKTDSKGRVKSFVVTGSARISSVLGRVKGEEIAQKRAKLNAKAEIVKWLKEKISSVEKSGEETIITLTGDGEKLSEQGKSTEYTSSQVSSYAEGIIRGTSVLYSKVITVGDEQKYVIILGWSAKNNKLAKQVKNLMEDDRVSPPSAPKKTKPGKKLLPEEEIISDEAADF